MKYNKEMTKNIIEEITKISLYEYFPLYIDVEKRANTKKEVENMIKEKVDDDYIENMFTLAAIEIARDYLMDNLKEYIIVNESLIENNDQFLLSDLESIYFAIKYYERIADGNLTFIDFPNIFLEDGLDAPFLVELIDFCDAYEYCEVVEGLEDEGRIKTTKNYRDLMKKVFDVVEEEILKNYSIFKSKESLEKYEFSEEINDILNQDLDMIEKIYIKSAMIK